MPEACTGTSAQCPPDQFQPSSFVCRPAVGACDVAETCPGNAAQCPDNQFKAAGTQCNDNNACTTNDQGNGAGFCIGTEVSGGTICGSVCCSDKTPYCCNGTCSNKAPVGVACKGGGNCCSGICTAAGICA